MRHLILIFFTLIGFGCSNFDDNTTNVQTDSIIESDSTILIIDTVEIESLPQIGDKLNNSIVNTSNNRIELVTSASFLASTAVKFQNCIFHIAWNNKGIVKYISTLDTNYITVDNIRVYMRLNDLKGYHLYKIHIEQGWGHYIELESDWSAAFCTNIGNGCTSRDLVENDTIKWLFKR